MDDEGTLPRESGWRNIACWQQSSCESYGLKTGHVNALSYLLFLFYTQPKPEGM